MRLTSDWISPLVRGVVVQICCAGVGVFGKNALVELRHFGVLLHVLLKVAVVLVHHFRAKLHHLDVWVSHVKENRRPHYHQANIHTEQVPRENVEVGRVEVEVVFKLLVYGVDLLSSGLQVASDVVLLQVAPLDAHFLKHGCLLLFKVVKVLNYSVSLLNFLWQNLHVSRLPVIDHLRRFIGKLLVFSQHLKHV